MAEMEALIQRLWRQLPQIGAFAFTASNGEGSATDWCGSGEGEVTVTDHQGGWLFAEHGRYTTPHGRVLTMHNRFWWQRGERGSGSHICATSSRWYCSSCCLRRMLAGSPPSPTCAARITTAPS